MWKIIGFPFFLEKFEGKELFPSNHIEYVCWVNKKEYQTYCMNKMQLSIAQIVLIIERYNLQTTVNGFTNVCEHSFVYIHGREGWTDFSLHL